MTRRLLLSYLSITAFVLLILEVPLAITFARGEENRLTTDVERDARVIATFAEDTLEGRADDDLQPLADQYRDRTDGRVVIVDADGVSVADSAAPDGPPRQFLSPTRPEFTVALEEGRVASGTRHSDTLGQNLVYVAVPVASSGQVYGAVRITYPKTELDQRIRRNWLSLGLLAAVVLAAVAAVGSVLARSVTRPVRALGGAARSLAAGDLGARAPTDAGPPEIRELAGQFNDMANRLEALVGAQRAFVADASHELRTPLTALRLRLENLRSAAPGALRADLEAVGEEIGRLHRLVEGLLALARAEGGRPERERVDVARVAADRVEAWAPLAEEQGVELALDVDDAGTAEVVRGGLEQMLDNLLANALDVAPEGSTVRVSATGADRRVEVHVADAGPGLAAEARARAFDRFWRAPGAAPAEGSGLGLAIVDQLARASGGSARLDEAAGGGVDAVVSLPASERAERGPAEAPRLRPRR